MTAQPYDDPTDPIHELRLYLTDAVRELRPGGGADPDELAELDDLGVVLPVDVHPLDDPSFDLDALLAWFVQLPSDRPCALDHWVAAELGRRRIGTVHIDPATALAAVEAADPHVFVVWARCKVCHWPVWTLAHTDPTPRLPHGAGRRVGFYQACGADTETDSTWRLLTPARARAVGAPWPLPWPFLRPPTATTPC